MCAHSVHVFKLLFWNCTFAKKKGEHFYKLIERNKRITNLKSLNANQSSGRKKKRKEREKEKERGEYRIFGATICVCVKYQSYWRSSHFDVYSIVQMIWASLNVAFNIFACLSKHAGELLYQVSMPVSITNN